MEKSDIRKSALKKRDLLTNEEREEKSRCIFEKLVEMDEYQEAENLLVYASVRSEVSTDDLILDALSCGKKVFCPKVNEKSRGIMEFVRILSLEELKEGCFKLREPEILDTSEIFAADEKDSDKTLMIMPGAAFDSDRNRIGYGAGFYDRYLERGSQYPAIAICFECQITDDPIPASEFDKKPLKVITEKRVI